MMMLKRVHTASTCAFMVTLMAAGCGGDLMLPSDNNGGGGGNGTPTDSPITSATENGITTSVVDATMTDAWVYFDLESKSHVDPSNAADSTEWDLGFQRFKISINGGISGTGGMELARLPKADFDKLTQAPEGPYITDEADSDDVGEIDDYAFNRPGEGETGPYSYNPEGHILSKFDVVYAVRSVEGNWYKVEVIEYYDDAGSPAHPQIRFAPISPPAGGGLLHVPAARTTYFSFETGAIVTPDNPETSTDWDISVNQAGWATNSGPTRAGHGGAILVNQAFDSITSAPTIGFVEDAEIPFPGPPGAPTFMGNAVLSDWFDYDSSTHSATAQDKVFILRTAAGSYVKLQIARYDNAAFSYSIRAESIPHVVEATSMTIDMTDTSAWTYLNLRTAEVVTPADPATSLDWDIGLSGLKVQTNSGMSGPGQAGAIDAMQAELTGVTSAPSDGYVADSEIPDPEDMNTMFSGNAVLGTWFESTNSGTVAADRVFIVRTAKSGYAKVSFENFTQGMLTVEWAYTGPNATDF